MQVLLLFMLAAPSVAVGETAAQTESAPFVTLQNSWRYLDDGTDPAANLSSRTAWTAADFDDATWKQSSGDAKFGAKRGAIAAMGSYTPTVLLNQYTTGTVNVPTFFFRTTFTVETVPAEGMALVGTLAYDDAAIVYVNGQKIASFYEPEGGYDTNLSYGGSSGEAPYTATFAVDPSCLKAGENILAVEIHQAHASSSDVYFEMSDLSLSEFAPGYLALTVGRNETERNLTWFLDSSEPSVLQYAEKSGDAFPASYTSVTATVKSDDAGYRNRATMKNLKPNTTYVYRIVSGNLKSKVFSFKTNGTGDFGFIFVGDPQIGTSTVIGDTAQWNKTLNKATTMFPDASLLVSAGDQVNYGYSTEQHQSFLSPQTIPSYSIAPSIGNHDNMGSIHTSHFMLPNVSNYGQSTAGSNYWYTYNNVLFMHLNTNNLSVAEHRAFMEDAIARAPAVDWKFVVLHHSLYSAADHSQDDNVLELRNTLPPVFDELDVDVVLQGHDHVYVRSYMMNGVTPDNAAGVQSSTLNPTGILYMIANTATGSKYYNIISNSIISSYAAVKIQEKTLTFSHVEITKHTFKITTYRTNDGSVMDTFLIRKTSEAAGHVHDLVHADGSPSTCEHGGVLEHWSCDGCGGVFTDAAAQNGVATPEAPLAEHTPGAPVIVQPTENQRGSETVSCTVCGKQIYKKNLPPSSLANKTTSADTPTTSAPTDTVGGDSEDGVAWWIFLPLGAAVLVGVGTALTLALKNKAAAPANEESPAPPTEE